MKDMVKFELNLLIECLESCDDEMLEYLSRNVLRLINKLTTFKEKGYKKWKWLFIIRHLRR